MVNILSQKIRDLGEFAFAYKLKKPYSKALIKVNKYEFYYLNLSGGIFDCLIMAKSVPMLIGLFLPCNGTGAIVPVCSFL